MTDTNAPPPDLDAIESEVVQAIRDYYDVAPAGYKAGDTWDDGSDRVAAVAIAHCRALIERVEKAEVSAKSSQQAFDELKITARADWQRAQKAEAECVLQTNITNAVKEECDRMEEREETLLARIKTLETALNEVRRGCHGEFGTTQRYKDFLIRIVRTINVALNASLSTTDAQPQAEPKCEMCGGDGHYLVSDDPIPAYMPCGCQQPDPRDERIKELTTAATRFLAWFDPMHPMRDELVEEFGEFFASEDHNIFNKNRHVRETLQAALVAALGKGGVS